ncbi:MAG TPA: serine/threonine-protein kinase [Kofleriaceae bacterium]|jgi:serine/threonine-protein kinase|nr:serine/threonine-protein kinase [Kofleriaceae bacterium]
MTERTGGPSHSDSRGAASGSGGPVSPDASARPAGDTAQRYRVLEKLESGGMAEVFRAESTGLQGFRKQVAIKRVLPHLGRKPKFISMFLDEARLSAQLSHSNCVQVFDIGAGDDAYFIVMEFVDGANLKSIATSMRNQGRTVPIPAAAFIAHEICKGLSYAHELTDRSGVSLHLVHRDVSPPNVLVTKYGEVKIVDFGLAKAGSQLEQSEPGIIKGKFSYLSPEAALGQELDCRADIFAVGIILWELLASRRLFDGDSDVQILYKVQAAKVPPISQINRSVPPELERVLHRALARDRQERYSTARELGQELSRFLFRFAHPVSGYDIATIVQATMREKENARLAQGSFIHKLIEEALLEFTSLQDDTTPSSDPLAAGAPLNAELFVDPVSPADRPAALSRPGDGPEHGDLAALEDDDDAALPSGAPPRPAAFRALAAAPAPGAPASAPDAAPPTHRLGHRAVLAIAVLVLLAAASLAWFTGLIPHP